MIYLAVADVEFRDAARAVERPEERLHGRPAHLNPRRTNTHRWSKAHNACKFHVQGESRKDETVAAKRTTEAPAEACFLSRGRKGVVPLGGVGG